MGTDEMSPQYSDVPREAAESAEQLLAQMRGEHTPKAGMAALADELASFEDSTGEPVASLFGADQAGLGLGFGDLRDPAAFLSALVCRESKVRLSVKVAVRVGIPAVISALGTALGGIGAVPSGILGGAAAVIVYEGVETLCNDQQ